MDRFCRTLKRSPKWSIAGLGLSALGIIFDFGIKAYRRAEATSRYEGPTREYLELAEVEPDLARALANHDGDGFSPALGLTQLARRKHVEPPEVLNWLEVEHERDTTFTDNFIKKLHQLKPDDGQYPASHSEGDLLIEIVTSETEIHGQGIEFEQTKWVPVDHVTEDGRVMLREYEDGPGGAARAR